MDEHDIDADEIEPCWGDLPQHSKQYDVLRLVWRTWWDRLDLEDWTTPWLDETWRDGNPFFSAINPDRRLAVRLLVHPDAELFPRIVSDDGITELQVSSPLSSNDLWKALDWTEQWITRGFIGAHVEHSHRTVPLPLAA